MHRAVLRFNYADGERLRQQNARTVTTAVLSDNYHNFRNVKIAPVLQFFSNFANGASNELFIGYNKWFNRRDPLSAFPQIRVNTVTGVNGNTSILAGADQFSQGNQLDTRTWEVTENFTFRPMGNHTITVGTRNEYVWLRNHVHSELARRLVVPQPRQHGRRQRQLVPQGAHPVRRRQRLLQPDCRTPSTRRISGRPPRVSPSRRACAST